MARRFFIRAALLAAGLYCVGMLIQKSMLLHLNASPDLSVHIERLGLGLLVGATFGAAAYWLVVRAPIIAALAFAGLTAAIQTAILGADAENWKLVEGALGTFFGLMMMAIVLRSWSSLYGQDVENADAKNPKSWQLDE